MEINNINWNESEESFVFYKSFAKSISRIPDKNKQLELVIAIITYGLFGEEPQLNDWVLESIFDTIQPQLKANRKRRTNGRKGGRPKEKENVEKSIKKPQVKDSNNHRLFNKKTTGYESKKPNEKEKEKEKENETVKENEKEKSKTPIPTKKSFGEFNNVKLTEQEYKNLVIDYTERTTNKYIEKLGGYIASTGKKYNSHYATIQNWARKDGIERWSVKNNIELN